MAVGIDHVLIAIMCVTVHAHRPHVGSVHNSYAGSFMVAWE